MEDQKKTKSQLIQELAELRTLAENTYDWAYWLGPDGRFRYLSPSCQRITGYSPAEFLADPGLMERILHPDDREAVSEHLHRALERPEPVSMLFRITSRAGEERWIEHVCQPVYDVDGCWLGRRASNRDITDRKRAEEALSRERAFSDIIIGSIPGWFYVLDSQGRFVRWNHVVEEATGLSPEKLCGMDCLSTISADDRKLVAGAIREVFNNGQAEVQARVVAKDGVRHFRFAGRRMDAGLDSYLVGSGVDVTERHRMETRVAQLNQWKERLLGSGGLSEKLVLLTDGVVEVLDADFARIWVIKEGDLCEKGCLHAMVTEGPDVCRDRTRCLHLVASSGRYPRVDGSHRRVPLGCYKIGCVASGEDAGFVTNDVAHDPRVHDRQWAENLGLVAFAGYRLLSPEGLPLGVLAMFSRRAIDAGDEALLEDLAHTASQAIRAGLAEESLREAHDELEQRVKDRTAELTQTVDQLHKEVQERARAEKALQQERRTLEHLLRSSDHERQVIAYEIHDGLAQHLAGAIMQFQAYPHLKDRKPAQAGKAYDAGMTMLQQGHFEARRLISGVRPPILDELGVATAIAHLVQEQQLQEGPKIELLSSVEFDRLDSILENAIYRIVQEGLANACWHSRSEKVRVEMVQSGDHLRIMIQDWGIGFAPDVAREGCFGLEGIRQRARLLGGTVVADSAPGKGTRIVVELPLIPKEKPV
jgi:PAS domain S-box-containing protein